MLQPLAKTELALRETLVHKASGDDFERLARFHQFPKPANYDEASWRAALQALLFGVRGTPGTTFSILKGAFSYADVSLSGCSINPASPHRLLGANGTFQCAHVGRLVEVTMTPTGGTEGTWVFHSVGRDTTNSAYLELAPIKTTKWRGANWANGPFTAATQNVSVRLLPFIPQEDVLGFYRLFVDLTENLPPSTYFLAGSGVDRDAVDVDMPDQGHLMDLFNANDNAWYGDQGAEGPRPIYLQGEGGSVVSLQSLFDPFLAAGVHMRANLHEFCP